MSYRETDQCAPGPRGFNEVKQVDVKQGLQNEVKWLEQEMETRQEQLRVVKEKLKLIEKNKDLEAYINLLNR